MIITEGWLGPIIKQHTTPEQIKEYQRWVKNVYLQWIEQMAVAFANKPIIVFTIPIYLGYDNGIEQAIRSQVYQQGFQLEALDELYKREQHKVARKILILTPRK